MAVKLIRVISTEVTNEKNVVVELVADAKTDVVEGMHVIGLPSSYNIQFGSYVCTKNGDIGILGSDSEWSWVGDEEEGTRTLSLAKPAVSLERQSVEPISESLEEERAADPVDDIEDEQTDDPVDDEMR